MLNKQLSWKIEEGETQTTVVFTGDLDEKCSLERVPPLSGRVAFDLAGIRRVSSGGVTRWMQVPEPAGPGRGARLRAMLSSGRYTVEHGPRLPGPGVVQSFFAPYVCAATGEEQEILLTPEQVPDADNPPRLSSEMGSGC